MTAEATDLISGQPVLSTFGVDHADHNGAVRGLNFQWRHSAKLLCNVLQRSARDDTFRHGAPTGIPHVVRYGDCLASVFPPSRDLPPGTILTYSLEQDELHTRVGLARQLQAPAIPS